MSASGIRGLDVVATLLALFSIVGLAFRARKQRQFPLPPGPRGYPFIGNLLDMPKITEKGWELYSIWGERYGNIASIRIPGKTIIVVNDLQIATDMLDKKGAIYSGRPTSPMELLAEYERFTTNLPYNRHLKEQRKFIARSIGTPQLVTKFHSNYEYQACMFIKRVLAAPNELDEIAKKSTGAVQLDLAYGYQMKEGDDPLVNLLLKINFHFVRVMKPAHFIVDVLPILRFLPSWFPGIQFHKFAQRSKKLADDLANDPYEVVKREMAAGNYKPSFVSDILSKSQLTEERVFDLKWAANILYSAGSDTMAATIRVFILMMVVYPEVQQKIHAEVDLVVGCHRLPNIGDKSSMPYIQAVMKEALRIMPPVPLGLMHETSSADIHNGYYIPEGAAVIVNVWQLLHDSSRYKDPFTFNPQRFLGPEPELDPYRICFGFGRRVCAGLHVADAFVWVTIARIAATLTLGKAKTKDGQTIEPVCDVVPSIVSRPAPFVYDIQMRHDDALRLIEEDIQNRSH